MVNKPKNHGEDWTAAQDNAMRTKAKGGMPAEAIKLGAAGFVLPPNRIGELLTSTVRPVAR